MSDILGSLLTFGIVGFFLVFAEGLAKLDKLSRENARKIIHIGVGHVVLIIPIFETRWIAAGIPAVFVIGNFLLSPMSPIKKLQLRTFEAGHAWGTILYPISLSVTVFIFFEQPWFIIATFFPVVYGDGFAAVFGPKASSGKFVMNGNTKTLLGTGVISLFSFLSTTLGVFVLGYDLALGLVLGLYVAIISPFVEIISPKGTDNLILPVTLIAAIFLIQPYLSQLVISLDLFLFGYGVVFGLLFALGGYITRVLTSDGAIAGFMITLFMLGVGGISIGAELFLFFVLGSGATKLVKNIAGETQEEFEKGGEQRDAIQAMAKAGVPSILSFSLLFTGDIAIFYIITGIMAAALIDTMSTEVGIATAGTPVHILQPWKKAKSGQTGVISAKGTVGGIAFGSIFAILIYGFTLLDPTIDINSGLVEFLVIVIISGTSGMLADSVIGTSLQRHNKCQICDKILEADEHHETKTVHHSGLSWLNNDLTNILGTSIGGLIAYLLYLLF